MRAIIPAAGEGRRLLPLTEQVPKCLLPVGGTSILERLLSQLVEGGVTDVVCVVGHRADRLERHVAGLARRPPVTFVRNPDYARSNSIVSLLATVPFWDRDFAILESDIVASTRLVESLLRAEGDAMAIDATRSADDVDMAVEVRRGAIWHLEKDMPPERVSGEALPLFRFGVESGARLSDVMRKMVAAGTTDVWYQYAVREVAKEIRIAPIHARPDEWIEVDTAEDLEAANAALRDGAGARGRTAATEKPCERPLPWSTMRGQYCGEQMGEAS